MRPGATDSVPEEEDSDRAVHVAPASDEETTKQNDDRDDYDANRVSDTINQPEVLKKDNNNDNDYSDDDDDADADDDDNYEEEPDEQEGVTG